MHGLSGTVLFIFNYAGIYAGQTLRPFVLKAVKSKISKHVSESKVCLKAIKFKSSFL